MLALTIGTIISFTLFFNKKQRLYYITSLIILTAAILVIPALSDKMKSYFLKGADSFTTNRVILWGPSYEAAKIGGMFGIGYGISAEEVSTPFVHYKEDGKTNTEKRKQHTCFNRRSGYCWTFLLFVLPLLLPHVI